MKRTPTQAEFDANKHGWSFCNNRMLRRRIELCSEIAKKLAPDDERHEELKSMRAAVRPANN